MAKPWKSFWGMELDKPDLNLSSTIYSRDIKDSELKFLYYKIEISNAHFRAGED